MKSTGIIRKVDELGRIVLPIELRRTLDIEVRDEMEIFIDDGKIAAVGKHTELYERCTDYRNMVDLQKLDEEKGGNA